jgi:hypothetical protein
MGLRSCWDSWQRTDQFLLCRPRRRVNAQKTLALAILPEAIRGRTEGVTAKPAAATYLPSAGQEFGAAQDFLGGPSLFMQALHKIIPTPLIRAHLPNSPD